MKLLCNNCGKRLPVDVKDYFSGDIYCRGCKKTIPYSIITQDYLKRGKSGRITKVI